MGTAEILTTWQCLGVEVTLIFGTVIFFCIGFSWLNLKSYSELVDICVLHVSIILFFALIRACSAMTLCAPAFNNTFESNALTGLGSVIVLSLSLILLIGSLDYLKSQKLPIFELSILLLLLVAGLCALMKVKSVFTLYLCIEWQSIILYISICFIKVSVYAIEASLIYYIFSVFLTLLLLFGVSILYYTVGTLDFNSLKILFSVPLEEWSILQISIWFIFFGLLVKLAIFPFHGWIDKVYSGTNWFVFGLIATVPKIVFIIVLIFLVSLFSIFKFQIGILLGFLGCLSIIIGTLNGLYETKVRKLLAYSAMVQMGHVLVAISLQNITGFVASIYLSIIYCVLFLGIIIICMLIRNKFFELIYVTDLGELLMLNKWYALSFSSFLLSLAGLPLLAGFAGKLYLFLAVIQQGEYIYAFILLAASIITTVYYLRVIRFIYFDVVNSRNVKKLQPSKASLLVSLLLVLITFFNISLFFYQSTLILLITNVIILTFYL